MMSALGPFLLLSHVRMEAELLRTGGGVTQQTLWNTDHKKGHIPIFEFGKAQGSVKKHRKLSVHIFQHYQDSTLGCSCLQTGTAVVMVLL